MSFDSRRINRLLQVRFIYNNVTMYTRYVYAQFKNNSYFIIGLLAGFYLALTFIPLENEVQCSLGNVLGLSQKSIENTTEDYDPVIDTKFATKVSKQAFKKLQRPRYYSTELGIRDKLFVGVMTTEQNLDHQATAINKTIAHIVNRIKFFITANIVKNSLNLSNVVGFTDTREMLKPFHVLKYIADNFLEEFDYFFLASDMAFLNGRKLVDVVNRISVSEDVYMGTVSDVDSHYCNLDSGILLSNSVLKKIQENLDWCVRNSYSPQHFENIGRCVLHSTSLKCTQSIQGQTLTSIRINPKWQPTHDLAQVVSVFPVQSPEQTYKLHAYVSRLHLERASQEIGTLRWYLSWNLARHPNGYRNATWPGGLRSDIGITPPKPATRFDHIRWVAFNETHTLLPDDHHGIMKLRGADKMDLELVLEAAWGFAEHNWPHLRPISLVEGQRHWDPARALRYLLLLRFANRETGEQSLRHLEVCKPLGATRILPVPYVTESARVTIATPIMPAATFDNFDPVAQAKQFLALYTSVCLHKADKTLLVLILMYKWDSPSKGGSEDPYDPIKKEALELSDKFRDSGGKVEWFSIRLPPLAEQHDKRILRAAALDIAMSRFTKDTLVLWTLPNMEFSNDFLNRVRLNTIMGNQVFSPIPFARYDYYMHKQFADKDGNKPQTNTGRFDENNRGIISFYKRDYENARSKFKDLPPLYNESEMPAYLERAVANNQIDAQINIFLAPGNIHVLRAPEPGVTMKPHLDPPCKDSDMVCLKNLERNNFDTLNLGTRTQLAKMILESET